MTTTTRRRHRACLLTAAVVVLVLLVGVGVTRYLMTRSTLPEAETPPDVDVACPGTVDPVGPEVIRTDKVRVARLCAVGRGAEEAGLTDVLLRTGVIQLSNVVAMSAVETRAQRCRTDREPTYHLVFGYDDGGQVVSEIDLRRCETVVTGEAIRKNPQQVVAAFRALVRAQAESSALPSTAEDLPPCPAREPYAVAATSPDADPTDLASARVCAYGEAGSADPGLRGSADVPADRVDELGASINHSSHRDGDYCPGGGRMLVMGITDAGDVLNAAAFYCMDFVLVGRYPTSGWTPSREMEGLLNGLVREAIAAGGARARPGQPLPHH